MNESRNWNCKASSADIDPTAFVASNAIVIGDTSIGPYVSVLFGAVIRGDTAAIRIGRGSNIQDLCCLHADPEFPCLIGERVTIGHRAVVHGAIVEDNVLIGIGAVVLNGAKIRKGTVIAAGALITEGTEIPPDSVVMGVPGKVVRNTDDRDKEMIAHAAQHYIELGQIYLKRDL